MENHIWQFVAPFVLAMGCVALGQPSQAPSSDNLADTRVATDGLGRSLPMNDTTGPLASNKTVGHLYQTFHKPGKGRCHWAQWLGKPLLLASSEGLSAEVIGFFTLDFKWADNIQQTGDWSDFTLNGDVAPNDRFNFRAIFKAPRLNGGAGRR